MPMSDDLDITDAITWEDGLPVPQWDLIAAWVEARGDPEAPWDAWTAVARQWLTALGPALGGRYGVSETEHFLGLAPTGEGIGPSLLGFAERCRSQLLSLLGGVTDFLVPGKQVVVALASEDDYYRYISLFSPDGEQGGSAGLHIREGYPHVALRGNVRWARETVLAHELTHSALHYLGLPQWIEEGLAQMFEHDMAGRSLLELDPEKAGEHKRYWGKRGLDAFWRGEGFSRPGKVQELSYQLAEILIRLLVEDSRPRWFGLVKEPRTRFFAFLRGARASDCGEWACRRHLGFGLSDLAAKFLGPGDWGPKL
jgi:hypothetical protein